MASAGMASIVNSFPVVSAGQQTSWNLGNASSNKEIEKREKGNGVQRPQRFQFVQAVRTLGLKDHCKRRESGNKKRKPGIDDVRVQAGIVVAYTGIRDMMEFVAEGQRSFRRDEKLHAQTSFRGKIEAR